MKGFTFLAVVLSLVLAGCGFKPLYSTSSQGLAVDSQLSSVIVDQQDDRLGQLVRNEIVSEIRPVGSVAPEKYRLALEVKEKELVSVDGFDTEAVRQQLRVQARFALFEIGTNKKIFTGGTFSQTSYDVIDAPVANLQAKSNAQFRAAREIGVDIKTRLAAHFSSQ